MNYKIAFFLVLLVTYAFPQSPFKVLYSASDRLVVEVRPQYTDSIITTKSLANEFEYIPSGGILTNLSPGNPAIYMIPVPVAVPSEKGNRVSVISSEFRPLTGKPAEVKNYINNQIEEISRESLSPLRNNFIPSVIVEEGEYVVARGVPIKFFNLNTVTENNGELNLLISCVIEIKFSPQTQQINVSDLDYFKDLIVNYDALLSWRSERKVNRVASQNSVLSSGKWFKFETEEEGFYRIRYQDLALYGIDAATVDPRTIKIYNNGGNNLPENNTQPAPLDPLEIAITIVGEEDGRFDPSDYIIFYSTGISYYEYDSGLKNVARRFNPYSTNNIYLITSGGTQGKRIQEKQSLNNPSASLRTTSPAFYSFNVDKTNFGRTGRFFVGDEFSELMKTRTYNIKLDAPVAGVTTFFRYWYVNSSTSNVPFRVEENGTTIVNKVLRGNGSDIYSYGILDSGSVPFTAVFPDERSIVRFTFSAPNSSSYGYLDFYELLYQRHLRTTQDQITFFSPLYNSGQDSVFQYNLSNFSNTSIKVYDITNHSEIKIIKNPVMQSAGEFRFQVLEEPLSMRKYYAYCGELYKTPVNASAVQNQNIKGDIAGAKLIIVTNKVFAEQALRLKQFRETNPRYPLETKVFYIDEIFNEFGGGFTDPSALRNFIKFAYDNWLEQPQYVLLMGGGTYDFKNIEGRNNNFILTYQTREFTHEILSFCTDDFFAWIDGDDKVPDIAIGRIPNNSIEEARTYIDKLIEYETSMDEGSWRNLITLVADDALTSQGRDGAPNTQQSERLANQKIPGSYDLQKIYLVNYPTVQTSLGRRKPAVNTAIVEAFNSGTVILNYIGHGSPDLWAHEQVFVQSSTIPQLTNNIYPFLTAATCDFGIYDRPTVRSATVEMLLRAQSGIIGAFTAVRPVYSGQNAELTYEFFTNLLSSEREQNNLPISIGRALQKTKLFYFIDNDQKFHIFGDPSIKLRIPQYNAKLDSINGLPLDAAPVQIKALSTVNIDARILKPDGSFWNDFNGETIVTVFDSQTKIPLPEIGPSDSMVVPGGLIFRGRVSVNNGKVSSNFVVPKDISYENKNGKIVAYFRGNGLDGIGFTNNVIIGGTDENVVDDGKGPDINIYFDNPAYTDAFLVRPNSTLFIELSDETGLNTTGTGLGHKIEGYFNGDDSQPIDFTTHFTGDLDAGGKSGKIEYKFLDLPAGENTLTVKAWDVFNNSSTASVNFKVISGTENSIEYVMNYPNPFAFDTYFTFQHNLSELIDVKINIFSVAGRKIHEIERNFINERFVKIEWDGRDKEGDLLANGTYLYKLSVKTPSGFNRSVTGKFSIIR